MPRDPASARSPPRLHADQARPAVQQEATGHAGLPPAAAPRPGAVPADACRYGLGPAHRLNPDLRAPSRPYPNPNCAAAQAGAISTEDIIIDAKSGVSGAGRGAKQNLLYTEIAEGINCYGVGSHRHMPEIEQARPCAPRAARPRTRAPAPCSTERASPGGCDLAAPCSGAARAMGP